MKTSAITYRFVDKACVFTLYKMRLTKKSKKLVWKKQPGDAAFHSALSYGSLEWPLWQERKERIVEQHNAILFSPLTISIDGMRYPRHNGEVGINDPIKFFLICMQLQKEENDVQDQSS